MTERSVMCLVYEVATREPVPEGFDDVMMADRIVFEIGQLQTRVKAVGLAFDEPMRQLARVVNDAIRSAEQYSHLQRKWQKKQEKHRAHVAVLEARLAKAQTQLALHEDFDERVDAMRRAAKLEIKRILALHGVAYDPTLQ